MNLSPALDDLASGARVVVGCSGGADSLALLALACGHGFDVHAVYVDHGLRPGTAHDLDVVTRAAARFGAYAHVEVVDIPPGPNLESRARDARYAALERARVDVDAAAVLVAHTRDDQAETVLLQMLRGAGTTGLAGMAARRGFVRRPLLTVRRHQTHELCASLGLAPAHDPMNDDLHHRRVWLRREVIPRLERGADRDLVEVLARQAEVFRDDDELLESYAAQYEPDDAAAVSALPAALARRVIRRWLRAPAPPSIATVERVLAVARGEARAAELPGGDRIERARGRLVRVGRVTESVGAPVGLELPGRARFCRVEIEAWIEHAPPVAWPDGRERAVCDADRLPASVVVRAAAPGEKFRPLGRNGSKSVHDALAEAGIAAGLRAAAPIVATTEPVWVVGYRIDDRVRVTTGTRRFLWLSAEPAAT
ncbi:MAG TPA: tRNA lysidine(34) synthetase TilS [Acidimicrobiia bacterium]|nr:tRNA lysidine(34) synthetase TilS [Acidimicrobiia bacterium]